MHGNNVLDFGAGQCRNPTILAKKGIACANFEPYPVPWDDTDGKDKSVPSLELSRKIYGDFLKLVAKKTHWDSIFMSAVLIQNYASSCFWEERTNKPIQSQISASVALVINIKFNTRKLAQ